MEKWLFNLHPSGLTWDEVAHPELFGKEKNRATVGKMVIFWT